MRERITTLTFGSVEEMNDVSTLLGDTNVNDEEHPSSIEERGVRLDAELERIVALSPEEKREQAQRVEDDYYATRPGLRPVAPTPLEQDYLDGKLGKLVEPNLSPPAGATSTVARIVRPVPRARGHRGTRRAGTSARARSSGSSDESDLAQTCPRCGAVVLPLAGSILVCAVCWAHWVLALEGRNDP